MVQPLDNNVVIGPGIPPENDDFDFDSLLDEEIRDEEIKEPSPPVPPEKSCTRQIIEQGYCVKKPKAPEQKPLPGFEGLGPDAEVETNAKGGMQSKSPSALHLVDPGVLRLLFEKYKLEDTCDLCSDQELVEDTVANAGILITTYMTYMLAYSKGECLMDAMILLCEGCPANAAFKAGEVLLYGATKGNNGKGYPINNWRRIPREDHINHALNHIVGYLGGDRTDDHIGHAVCRLSMALATQETDGFWYTKEPMNKADF